MDTATTGVTTTTATTTGAASTTGAAATTAAASTTAANTAATTATEEEAQGDSSSSEEEEEDGHQQEEEGQARGQKRKRAEPPVGKAVARQKSRMDPIVAVLRPMCKKVCRRCGPLHEKDALVDCGRHYCRTCWVDNRYILKKVREEMKSALNVCRAHPDVLVSMSNPKPPTLQSVVEAKGEHRAATAEEVATLTHTPDGVVTYFGKAAMVALMRVRSGRSVEMRLGADWITQTLSTETNGRANNRRVKLPNLTPIGVVAKELAPLLDGKGVYARAVTAVLKQSQCQDLEQPVLMKSPSLPDCLRSLIDLIELNKQDLLQAGLEPGRQEEPEGKRKCRQTVGMQYWNDYGTCVDTLRGFLAELGEKHTAPVSVMATGTAAATPVVATQVVATPVVAKATPTCWTV